MNEKIGRNDPCPCGSGKKYKSCCMNKVPASEKIKQHKLKAKWLNQPEVPNLMDRVFGDTVSSMEKKYEPGKSEGDKT